MKIILFVSCLLCGCITKPELIKTEKRDPHGCLLEKNGTDKSECYWASWASNGPHCVCKGDRDYGF